MVGIFRQSNDGYLSQLIVKNHIHLLVRTIISTLLGSYSTQIHGLDISFIDSFSRITLKQNT